MSDFTASPPRLKLSWLIGTLAAFMLFALIGAYSSRMTWDTTDYDQDRAAQRYQTLAKVRHDEQLLLTPVDAQGKPTAEWVDQTKGVVRIPIDEAMTEEIDTLKAQPAAMGAEIPGAVPPPPAKPAPAAAGAPKTAPAKPAAKPAAKPTVTPTGAGPAPATPATPPAATTPPPK